MQIVVVGAPRKKPVDASTIFIDIKFVFTVETCCTIHKLVKGPSCLSRIRSGHSTGRSGYDGKTTTKIRGTW